MFSRACITSVLLSSSLAAQWIEPRPSHAEAGSTVSVEARRADGQPLEGLAVVARTPGGDLRPVGTTRSDGRVVFEVAEVGAWRVEARQDGVDLVAPLQVRAAPARIWLALLGTPLGLFLAGCVVARRGLRSDR